MKRFSLWLIAITIFLTMGTIAQAKTYINGIDGNYPPFSFIAIDGTPTGFDVDAMNWIANKMNFKIVHVPINWDGIIPALKAGKIDMICSGMSMSPERAEQVAFSTPYYEIQKLIVAKNDSSLTMSQIFNEKRLLGVQRGTNEHLLLEERIKKDKLPVVLRFYDSPPMSIEDLLNGRVDAIAIDSAPANDAMNKGKAIKFIGEYAKGDTFGVAIRKDDKKLLDMVNKGYEYLKKDPYWQELHAKYLENE